MNDAFFKRIEQKTGVSMDNVFSLAQSFQSADFKDEKTVRNLIKQVSAVANKPITKDLEDKIVETITAKGKSIDFNTISDMMNKKDGK
ncbi:stage VI sporulation protein F [Jeotgalibacillus sp. ET6]|uniref:stage VI sporulation protein F n=1 Tax=Jeotgalibacillus sp. ET6 TaxID=3037260 RepID=UPI0024181EB7|nr:stage VI sporulation protein F [Jeotgalibacillus sp. ET6]MDG5473017.1 stage VI sporulation protein F [Jeotgalibacillus sp. ET6]